MATTQSTTTQTNRSAGAKKAAATRSAAARKRSAAAKKAAATRAESNRTPVDYATEYAEKAVLIPLGAGLEREIKSFRRDLEKQATSTAKNVTTQAEIAQTRVEALVKDLQAEFSKRVSSVA